MDAPRVTWYGGMAVFVVGFIYGAYWMATREGIGALGGPVIMLVAAGTAVVVMAIGTGWSMVRRAPLAPMMWLGTVVLALALGGIASSIVVDNWRSMVQGDGVGGVVSLPVVLVVVAAVGIGATAWAWVQGRDRQA